MDELRPMRSIPLLRREPMVSSDELGVGEYDEGIVRGGAILAVPEAPVRVFGSGRRGGGRVPMAESGDWVLTLGAGVGEARPLLVPVKRMDPMVSVAATRRVWMVMGVPSSVKDVSSVYCDLEDGVARVVAGGGEGVA